MSYDFVQTSPCGHGQRHPHGLVGKLWRINNPDSVRVGDCFLKGRLKKGDLFLCIAHSGDCFQHYIYVEEYSNCLIGNPKWRFGSYGIGDSDPVDLENGAFDILRGGGRIELVFSLRSLHFYVEAALEATTDDNNEEKEK